MSDVGIDAMERSLERERQALAGSLAALRQRLSPSVLVEDGKEALLAQASPLLAKVDAAVRAQPLVAGVAGVALAALIFGRRAANDLEAAASVPAMSGTKFEALTRWEDEGGPPAPEPVDPEEDWLSEAQGLRETAQGLLAKIDDAARRGLAPAAQLAKHRADVVSALAAETRVALGRGLESLSDAAREQAILARERIYLGRVTLAQKGRDQVEAHPLVSGALIAAAGAALACLFPRTETEDRLLGQTRDHLVDDLAAMVKTEAAKASDLAQTVQSALKSDLSRAAQVVRPPVTERPSVTHH